MFAWGKNVQTLQHVGVREKKHILYPPNQPFLTGNNVINVDFYHVIIIPMVPMLCLLCFVAVYKLHIAIYLGKL